jgi:hypothetical protein
MERREFQDHLRIDNFYDNQLVLIEWDPLHL